MTSGEARLDSTGVDVAAPSDIELLRAHVDGDPEAFGELVRRHRDRLWAVALRTIGDREEAADAVQDALLSAHRAAARFRGDSAVTTWLHRIVVNACLDRARRRQAHPTVPLPGVSRSDDGPPSGPEPAAPVQDHDTALVVREALAALPAEQRAALVLVDVQGYPVAEAAEILGVAEGTIKSRCARGRARMAISLAHLRRGSDEPDPAAGERAGQHPGKPLAASGGPLAASGGASSSSGGRTARPGQPSASGGDRSAQGSGEARSSAGGHDGSEPDADSRRNADHAGNQVTPAHVPSGSRAATPRTSASKRRDQR